MSPSPMAHRIAPSLVAACLLSACSAAVPSPDAVIDAYVRAVERGDWSAAYRALDGDALGFASESDFAAYCEEHGDALRAQAQTIAQTRRSHDAALRAALPVGDARVASLTYEEGGWALDEHIALAVGGDDPESTLRALGVLLRSDALDEMLGVLDDALRQRYLGEIDQLARALEDGADATVSVYGDAASVEIGDVTIRLVRQDGTWRVSGVDQPYGYGGYYDPYW